MKIDPMDRRPYRALMAIRREGMPPVRPASEAMDGKEITVSQGWVIGSDERAEYAGEIAWLVIGGDPSWPGWVAGGDLSILGLAPTCPHGMALASGCRDCDREHREATA